MKRADLEHIIRATGAIVRDQELIVFGSQAVLGSFPNAPKELLQSFEADIYPKNSPEGCLLIDGAIGEESIFHKTFGYYAHGVSPEVATLPEGWQDRLVPLINENTGGVTGWCLEVHDLAISKLAVGRKKDLDYVRSLLRHQMVRAPTLEQRLQDTPIPAGIRESLHRLLGRLIRAATDKRRR